MLRRLSPPSILLLSLSRTMSSDSVSGSKHVADTPAEAAAPDSKKARPAEEEVKPAAEQSGMYTRPGFKPEEHIFHKTNKGCALSYVIIYVSVNSA
jgi:hypothetical protein